MFDYTPVTHLAHDAGTNFQFGFNSYTGGQFHGPIEEIYCGFPTRFKVTAHGLPSESPTAVFIRDLTGDVEVANLDASGVVEATRIDDDWFEVPINTIDCEWDNNSGTLTYLLPTDFTGYTVQLVLKKRWEDTENFYVASTDSGEIVLGNDDGGISINIPYTVTELWKYGKLVWFLEAYIPGSVKIRLGSGTVTHILGVPK